MEKLVYVLEQPADAQGPELRKSLIDGAVPALRSGGASNVIVFVNDEDVEVRPGLHPGKDPIRSAVSFWMHNSDDRADCEAALSELCNALHGYLVVESRPLIHEPPVGRRTPGWTQFTCIAKRKDISYDEFIRIWHGDHKIVAVETQSTTAYVRNVVFRRLTEGAPAWDGLVEEGFPIGALTDEKIFYDASSQADYEARLDRMLTSCKRFLDFEGMSVVPMSEWVLG